MPARTARSPSATARERIRVQGKRDVVLDVRTTRHGPVISDLARTLGGAAPHRVPAWCWRHASPASTPTTSAARGLSLLNQAPDVAAAGVAASRITAPVQNLMVADVHGIALFTTGRVPVRRSGDGTFPVPGWDGAHDWTGYVSGAALPTVVAPRSGIVLNANEPVGGTASTVFMGRDAPDAWRARRIQSLLSAASRFSPDDFVSMQGDVRDLLMVRLLPHLLQGAQPHDELSAAAIRELADWDGSMGAGRPEPVIAAAWLGAVAQSVLREVGDPDGAAALPGDVVLDVLTRRDAPSCGGSCPALLSTTLQRTVAVIAATQGGNMTSLQWGRVHRAHFRNPLWGGLPLLGRLGGADLAVGGDANTVDAQGYAPGSFAAVHGASFRGVYDLADLEASRFVIATGESGNPFSRHLLDFGWRWQHLQTVTLAERPAATAATLDLTPGGAPP